MLTVFRVFWICRPFSAAYPNVLHPRRELQRQPSAGPGGRAGCLLSDRTQAPHPLGSPGQHGEHRLLQLRWDQRHQRDQRNHPNGAGQPAYAGHLGGEPGAGLGAVSGPAGSGIFGPTDRHGALQRTAPPPVVQDTLVRRQDEPRGG